MQTIRCAVCTPFRLRTVFSLVCAFSRPFGVRFPVAFIIFKTAFDFGALSMFGHFHLDSFFLRVGNSSISLSLFSRLFDGPLVSWGSCRRFSRLLFQFLDVADLGSHISRYSILVLSMLTTMSFVMKNLTDMSCPCDTASLFQSPGANRSPRCHHLCSSA